MSKNMEGIFLSISLRSTLSLAMNRMYSKHLLEEQLDSFIKAVQGGN